MLTRASPPLFRLAASSLDKARTAASSSVRTKSTAAATAIAVGSDLKSSASTWQKARPWYDDDVESGSNLAIDNAVTMKELFGGRKVAVFGVPAPFTGVCTKSHVPPYNALAEEFRGRGVDELICYSVTDPYAHHNWAKAMNVDQTQITFLADVDCSWAKEVGLDRDYTGASLGVRSARFSMMVEDGIVTAFNDVEDAGKDAETLLGQA